MVVNMNNEISFGKRQKPQPVPVQSLAPKIQPYTGPDRRVHRRRKMLKGCKIIFNNNFSTFDGVIVNISETGACVKATNPAYVANEFSLKTVFGNHQYSCSVIWRNKQFIGVKFGDM